MEKVPFFSRTDAGHCALDRCESAGRRSLVSPRSPSRAGGARHPYSVPFRCWVSYLNLNYFWILRGPIMATIIVSACSFGKTRLCIQFTPPDWEESDKHGRVWA